MTKWLLIALGGAVGAVLRYALQEALGHRDGLPLGTLLVNVSGCFLIGLLATWIPEQAGVRGDLRLALLVGVLGGYTTFSSFAWESVRLAQGGRAVAAIGYVAASNALCLVGAALGFWAGAGLRAGQVRP